MQTFGSMQEPPSEPAIPVITGSITFCHGRGSRKSPAFEDIVVVLLLGDYADAQLESLKGKAITPEMIEVVRQSTIAHLLSSETQLSQMQLLKADINVGPPLECIDPSTRTKKGHNAQCRACKTRAMQKSGASHLYRPSVAQAVNEVIKKAFSERTLSSVVS
jgi:hypothetical protein